MATVGVKGLTAEWTLTWFSYTVNEGDDSVLVFTDAVQLKICMCVSF